jgi:hypothetical protein
MSIILLDVIMMNAEYCSKNCKFVFLANPNLPLVKISEKDWQI